MTAAHHDHEELPSSAPCVGKGADDGDSGAIPQTRSRRSAQPTGKAGSRGKRSHIEGYNALDEMEDESDASSSGGDWDDGDDDDVDDNIVDDEDDADMSDSDNSADDDDFDRPERHSLVVSLRYAKNNENIQRNQDIKVEGHAKLNGFATPPATSSIVANGDGPIAMKREELAMGDRKTQPDSNMVMEDSIVLEPQMMPVKPHPSQQKPTPQQGQSHLPNGFLPPAMQTEGTSS